MTAPHGISAAAFAAKWKDNARRERAGAQEHFIDLCHLLGAPTPNEADPSGEHYTFEAGAERTSSGKHGWADVWKRGYFGWEYKGAHADLAAAYRQLLDYREALENPPALVVSDMDVIEVHTNFTNTQPVVHTVTLDDLAEDPAGALRILRAVMIEPEALRPEQTPDEVTQAAASRFAEIAGSMQARGHHPETVAHFLNRVLFCLFAEDIGLLPRRIMSDLIASRADDPAAFTAGLSELFRLMADQGGYFGTQRIAWFNGGLFDDAAALAFTREELRAVGAASALDWSQVEPAILGTLFERGLDPDRRGQLGAHYTDRAKILMVVEPVVLEPLRREFGAMRARVDALMAGREPRLFTREGRRRVRLRPWERSAENEWRAFLERLRAVRVLDPACGSGNFLYVTLRLLKDLEQEAIRWSAERLRITGEFPQVGPHNVIGIEISPYAKELAGVSIWIGQIQWMRDHGYGFPEKPVLQPLDNIERRDAILARDAGGAPGPAAWPEAEFIVGNPPFLGDRRMRGRLGDEYVEQLRSAWDGIVPAGADLVCYWHEKARQVITAGRATRAGLLATNSIRGGANRRVLDRVKETGDIFLAYDDEPWVVEGAAVRVSIVGQDDGSETERRFDGQPVTAINADLTADRTDLTIAQQLGENSASAFVGVQKSGPFDLPADLAREMLAAPLNPFGAPNSNVVRRWVNASDLADRARDAFIVDFGASMSLADAAKYELPFEYVRAHVLPVREQVRRKAHRKRWWIHGDARPGLRSQLADFSRYICTPVTSKHRFFVWLPVSILPSNATVAIAREDNYTFGVLHSRAHELWALRMGTSLEDRPRYTPSTTFETFPFPWPLDTPDEALTAERRGQRDAIGRAARALDTARRRWLNPTEWVREEPDVLPSLPPRLLPVDEEAAKKLAKRTLTNLYNARPAWLANLHADLDAAVFAAYGWPEPPSELDKEELLSRLLALNLERAGGETTK